MPATPIMAISGSEPIGIKKGLSEISYIDERMIYPDYQIWSKQNYTVGIARASTNDLVRNKLDVASMMLKGKFTQKIISFFIG